MANSLEMTAINAKTKKWKDLSYKNNIILITQFLYFIFISCLIKRITLENKVSSTSWQLKSLYGNRF